MTKPDWKDAPSWALHLSRDDDGRWWWFENLPEWEARIGGGVWMPRGDSKFTEAFALDEGNGTLERRP